MPQPFAGIRVVDTTHVLAGPFCTYQLALLGADVIRVENPDPSKAEMTRALGPREDLNQRGLGTAFLAQNANKRSLALDLKSPTAKELMLKLLASADVMVENFRPGVMERLGFGYEAVRAVNPTIVYASLTGYGQSGPLANAPIYDHVMQAASGLMDVAGTKERMERIRFPLIDYATGLAGAFAVSAALFRRAQTGDGERVDVAMLDAAHLLLSSNVGQVLTTGEILRPRGNTAASGSPFSGFFATSDGLLSVTANTYEQAERLCLAVGRPDIMDDPRLTNWNAYPELGTELTARFEQIYAERPAEEWEQLLSAAGVPAARARSLNESLQHPQTQTRDSILPAGDFAPLGKELRVPGVPFKLGREGARVSRQPPALGEHSAEVLKDIGLNDAEIAALRDARVIA